MSRPYTNKATIEPTSALIESEAVKAGASVSYEFVMCTRALDEIEKHKKELEKQAMINKYLSTLDHNKTVIVAQVSIEQRIKKLLNVIPISLLFPALLGLKQTSYYVNRST